MHIERTGSFVLPYPRDEVFPLFTAEGERLWVPGWEPRYLHPDHPSNDEGTAFRTGHGDEETLWMVLRYAPAEGLATYARVTPGSRMGTVHVHCTVEAPSVTRVTVTYALTSLSERGAEALRAMTPEAYATMLEQWRELILGMPRAER